MVRSPGIFQAASQLICVSDDHRVVIDLSDWDSEPDEENEDEREGANIENIADSK